MIPPSLFRRTLALAFAEWLFLAPSALANPQSGVVHGGSAVITGQGTPVVTVRQLSNNAVLSWQTFNIQHGETTNFQQPGANSIAINRILDGQASTILGSLNANGHVYLINPNGVLFGRGSSVNVYALTAATSVKAGELAALGHGFDPSAVSAPGAKIENEGRISSGPGGFVYLVAPEVTNGKDGVIVAPGGEIQLAAGATVYLTDRADGTGLAIAYTASGQPGGAAVNLGQLVSDAGFVKMRAAIVRQNGVVEANAVREKDGKIELTADSSLELASGSLTEVHGGNDGNSPGGSVQAYSAGNAAVESGAVVDASGGAQGGAGGSIDVSAKGKVDLSGTFRVAGHHGSKGGRVLVDPDQVDISGVQTIEGADSVKVTANQAITLDPGATVSLSNPTGMPTYGLYSGGDIVFGANSQITDANSTGNPVTAQNHWNVQLVAGATDLTPTGLNPVTKTDLNSGGVYLSGGVGTTGALQPLSNNGQVSLTAGDLTVRAAGDVWIGSGGGLRDQTGKIDVQAGRDVRFAAGKTQDSVIENGSGSIRVVAGGSVILNAEGDGNAAIRTRGIQDPNNPGQVTRTDGGSILVWAQTGDVDAGNANRWLQPGPDVKNATFDILPVVADGILGIGSEVGGDVTVVAGGNVMTGNSLLPRTGGSAGNEAGIGDYTGGHIGVFGQPVALVARSRTQSNVLLPNAPDSRLLIVAGGDITGDYIVRHGAGVFRAGYALAANVDPGSLSADGVAGVAPSASGSGLARSTLATSDPSRGWVGTLARPITFDLLFGTPLANTATIDVLGANGVAVRTIESPSLVYPPVGITGLPNLQAPGYSPLDAAFLEAETGDVVLLGNDSAIVPPRGTNAIENANVRILPPSLRVTTHSFQRGLESRGGDLVLLNDLLLFPSPTGGLTLDVAGQVRTANFAANGQVDLTLFPQTVGAASLQAFPIPSGTVLVDPATGLQFTLEDNVSFQVRQPATPAQQEVLFRATPSASNGPVLVPKGTRIADRYGHVYAVISDTFIPAPKGRLSQGNVTLYAPLGGNATEAGIPAGTLFVTPDGTQFATTAAAQFLPGQASVTVNVMALQQYPGIDAGAGDLRLQIPIPGVAIATNRLPTTRPAQELVPVESVGVGAATNQLLPNVVALLLDPVPGVEGVYNPTGITGGADAFTFGTDPNGSAHARAFLQGPIGTLAAGHTLVLQNPSILPKGTPAPDVQFIVNPLLDASATLVPAVLKTLDVERNSAGVITSTRVDPSPTQIAFPQGDRIWVRNSGTTASIQQSDADPSFDSRSRISANTADYFGYYNTCRSGALCSPPGAAQPILLGNGPTHANDRTPASLFADAGFARVGLNLAQPATLTTNGSVVDLGLITEHSSSLDRTLIDVPTGNASFGAGTQTLIDTQQVDPQTGQVKPVAIPVPTDAGSGLEVNGPGTAEILVGVVPFATADKKHDGVITFDEFPGSRAVFDSLDQPDALGIKHGQLTPSDAPFIPTGKGGELVLASSQSQGLLLGIQTIGNLAGIPVPAGGASLSVVAAGDILLQDRGFIGTLQGGPLSVSSIGGAILGGFPSTGVASKRGIVTLFTPPGITQRLADTSGGGSISVDSFGDFNIGGLALAALSGSSITINSRGGSVNAGLGAEFSSPSVFFDENTGGVSVTYSGSGVFAEGGAVIIVAKKDIVIGAGITGAGLTISAGGSVLAGSGALSSTGGISISAGQTISGNIQAQGSISIAGGTLSSSASASSAGGLVTGAGAASVASNTGSGRASAENNLASSSLDRASFTGGVGNASGNGASGRRVVLIDVSSQPCAPNDKDCSS
ncbi:MAG TPA: filamentous hemagglutinin N-terminal domain-containing protein [Myxococcota bacterium]|nr:filamentous hemagglutinin N-terminal domain-containing protein [Myxococcota bacterium]